MKKPHLIVFTLLAVGLLVRFAVSQNFYVHTAPEPPIVASDPIVEVVPSRDLREMQQAPVEVPDWTSETPVFRPQPSSAPWCNTVEDRPSRPPSQETKGITPLFALESLIGPSAATVESSAEVSATSGPVQTVGADASQAHEKVQRIVDVAIPAEENDGPPRTPFHAGSVGPQGMTLDSVQEPGLLDNLAEISKDCPQCRGRGCSACIGPLLNYRGTNTEPSPVIASDRLARGRRGSRRDVDCSSNGESQLPINGREPMSGGSCECDSNEECAACRGSLRDGLNGLFQRPMKSDSAECSECADNGCSSCRGKVGKRFADMLDRADPHDCDSANCGSEPIRPGLPAWTKMGNLPRLCDRCSGGGCSDCQGNGIVRLRPDRPLQSLFGDGLLPAGFSKRERHHREFADRGIDDCFSGESCTNSECSSRGDRCSKCGDVGGWFAWGTYDNSHGIDGINGNRPLGFNNIAEEIQAHQMWVYAAREAETGEDLNFGYRLDFMFGTDGPDTQSFGDGSWDESWDTSNSYGFAMPQLYVEAAWQNMKVIIGHFYTIIGYEVVQAPDNFFYSHVYTFYYNEPFTHTGVLLKHEVTDCLTMYHGWTAGWDTGFSNGNNGSTYVGGIGFAPTDDFSLIYSLSFGDPGDDPVNHSDTFLQSVVADWMLTDRLEYVFHSDFQTRRSDTLGGKSYGVSNYLFYELTNQFIAGIRYEWFRDSRGVNAVGGASEHFHALTLGLNYEPAEGMMIRPEVRYDWVDRDDAAGPGGPFALGTKRSQFAFGLSGYFTF